MGVMHRIERPALYPGRTLYGRTSGPVVDCGDLVPGNEHMAGVRLYLDERETRELLLAWGWPRPEDYAEVIDLAERLQIRVGELEVELEEALESQVQVVSLQDVLASSASTATKRPVGRPRKEATG